MSRGFETWALIWLFFIALGSCAPDKHAKVTIYVDGKEVKYDQ